jgi:hypothetical protein
MIGCANVRDLHRERTVADGRQGVSNGIKSRTLHEADEGFRIGNTFHGEQADEPAFLSSFGKENVSAGRADEREQSSNRSELASAQCLDNAHLTNGCYQRKNYLKFFRFWLGNDQLAENSICRNSECC